MNRCKHCNDVCPDFSDMCDGCFEPQDIELECRIYMDDIEEELNEETTDK